MGLPALQAISPLASRRARRSLAHAEFFLSRALPLARYFGPLSIDSTPSRSAVGLSLFAARAWMRLCSLAWIALFWRLLEGIGAGAGSTLSLAIVRDLFDGATPVPGFRMSRPSVTGAHAGADAGPLSSDCLAAVDLWIPGDGGTLLLLAVFSVSKNLTPR